MKERGNTKRYSFEFRQKAVKLKLESGYSLKSAASEVGLSDTKQLRQWIKRYREEGDEGLKDKKPKIRESLKLAREEKDELKRLRAENALLHYLYKKVKKKNYTKRSKH